MDELIIRTLQGSASEGDAMRVRAWRSRSAANEARYQELARLWALTGVAEPEAIAGPPPAARELVGMTRPEAPDTESAGQSARGKSAGLFRHGLIAAALVVASFGLAMYVVDSGAPQRALDRAIIVTGAAERATVELGDGTVVRLAPESRLSVTGKDDIREVWVEGRAFFSVPERNETPFLVRTRAGVISVLGTRFTVDMQADSMRVSVIEGTIALSAGSEEERVRAGQAITAVGGRMPSVSEPVEHRPDLDWLGEFLAFQATPLSEVALAIERRFKVSVEILDDSVAGRTVTAWFSGRSIRQVLGTVCRVADVHCTLNDGVATIQP